MPWKLIHSYGDFVNDQNARLKERLLLIRCQLGDEDAYRELVNSYGPRLNYFLRKVSMRSEKVDDLAQEVWLDVLRQLPRLQNLGAFRTWLYRIAHGKAMLDFRRNGRAPFTTIDFEHFAGREEVVFSPDDVASIHLALDHLEPNHREVLVLRFLEDLSYEEISQIADCPVGTVRSRVHHAKAHLRRILENELNLHPINGLNEGRKR